MPVQGSTSVRSLDHWKKCTVCHALEAYVNSQFGSHGQDVRTGQPIGGAPRCELATCSPLVVGDRGEPGLGRFSLSGWRPAVPRGDRCPSPDG